ncbi:ABC transporter permease [Rubrimonas cliftonensis]|uniref:Peptide/nickel transport system permease protein n=1 Tax=Rubrimonas cliftonensis TaxID=89524 RepID=A0A1H4G2Q6_9RHOB|nr:ABC transporter permease [Rubrimonas cliftonensis]SEB03916.1 peptide/nickel transport system permease protein [Rubrimonas cliftonensis]
MNAVAAMALRRLALSAVVLSLVSAIVFVGTEILPGDALDSTIPADELIYYTAEDLSRMRAELGLDKPPVERFWSVFTGLATFDFGVTIVTREPVWDGIRHPLLNSLLMAGVAVVLTPLVAIGLGVLAALKPGGRLDAAISGATLFGYSMPDFVVGNVFIIVFALQLGLAPAVLMVAESAPAGEMLSVAALPVAALAVSGVAYQFRLLRAGMIEAMDSEFVERARLAGLSERRLVLTHALPGALIPMLNGSAQFVAGVVSGAVVIEAVFRYPGIGLELVRAVAQREVPTVQAIAFLAAFGVILSNLLADLAILALDPRVRRRADG